MEQSKILSGSLLKGILFYTIPIILSSMLQLLFNAADLVVVGQFGSENSVAAVGATSSLTNLFINLFIGLSVGAGVVVARSYGADDRDAVSKTVHTAIPTALISGFVIAIIGILLSKKMLVVMGTPDNVLPLSALYMKIIFAGMPFSMIYNYSASMLRAAGDTKRPLYHLATAGVINVILNLIFVTVFRMDVAGVALATIISQAVSAYLTTKTLTLREDCARLNIKKLKIYPSQLWKIVLIGLPAGIQGALFSISNVIIQSSVNSFGDMAMAGCAAAGSLEGFVYVIINSFSQSAVNFIGQNSGAKNYTRVRKTYAVCLGYATFFGIVSGTLMYAFAEPILSIYLKGNAEQIAYGVSRMTLICLPYFLCGIMDVSTGALRGLGVSVSPMIITVLGVCGLRIGWIATVFRIPEYHTLEWLFASYPISWAATFLVEFIVFIFIYQKQKKKVQQEVQCL